MRVATCIGDRHILVKSNKRRVQQHSLHVFCDHAMVRSFNPRFVLVDCGGGRQDEINLFFFVPVQRFTWMHISIQSKHCKDCFCNSQVSFHCTSYHLDVPSQFKRSWNGKEVGGEGKWHSSFFVIDLGDTATKQSHIWNRFLLTKTETQKKAPSNFSAYRMQWFISPAKTSLPFSKQFSHSHLSLFRKHGVMLKKSKYEASLKKKKRHSRKYYIKICLNCTFRQLRWRCVQIFDGIAAR